MRRVILSLFVALASTARAESWLELQLVPVSAQANVLQTEHLGSGGRATYHFDRFIGVYLGGLYNWHTQPSATYRDVHLMKFRLRATPEPATPLATWQLHFGAESIPLTGTFNIGERFEGTFGLVLSAGFGVGGTRTPLQDLGNVSYADSGARPMGHFGAGLRFAFDAFALHLGVHGSFWSSVVTRLNGCDRTDLDSQIAAQRAGDDPALAPVSQGCRYDPSVDPGLARLTIVPPNLALQLNLAAEVGLSWSL